jgi:transcriptional antiterminator
MIRKKLDILKENGVIDQEILEFNLEILELLKNRNIIEEEDEADTFITHLAMAMARKDDDEINAMEDVVLDEVKEDENFEAAKELWEEIEEMAPVTFHENETGYFYLHLVNLL